MLLIIFILWVIFNGRLTPETALPGVAISAALFWFAYKYMNYKPGNDIKIVRFFLRGLRYAGVVFLETVKSNIYVTKIVFSRKINIDPQMVFFKTSLRTEAARVVLANSITLTPGTLTVVLTDGIFCVHCLKSDLSEGIDKSLFVEQLRRFETPR
ncbi:MAG: Na+/H+ antiporter subunit E [Oscillospiraceae bacterium]|nr:Na+/H+ antiporter subunit E [Oscillospiraceae bacterium]